MKPYLGDVEWVMDRHYRRGQAGHNAGQPLPVKGATQSVTTVARLMVKEEFKRAAREERRALLRKEQAKRRWLKW
jgi:hypothetical protein